jgi:NADPH-dependent 2,4-dienoyl-CoA reductase/sulfur reductase-like enzyme/putative sterol carrier protein
VEKKRVLIAGAGVAGLEAARAAAGRGHRVTLVEAADRIGGAMHLASAAPMKVELRLLLPYYKRLLRDLAVDLRLDTPLAHQLIEEIQPDVLVLAMGALPEIPAMEGLQTCSHSSYADVLSGKIPSGNKICVLGGGMVGIDVADLLTSHKKDVTIVEPGKRLAADLYALVAREMEKVISENKRVQLFLESRVERIDGNTLICDQGGITTKIPFDHLVVALERIPSPDPLEGIGDQVGEVIRIGDCKQPGLVFEAVHAAYNAALTVGVPRPVEPSGDSAVSGDVTADASDHKTRIAGKIKGGAFGLEDIPDYLDLLVTTCNTHPKIQKKSKKANLVFQFQVEGGQDFWIRIDRGHFSTGQGSLENVDVTIRMDCRIAPGIFSGQVNAASAYMNKELAFIGPMKHGIAFRTWVNLVKQELGL